MKNHSIGATLKVCSVTPDGRNASLAWVLRAAGLATSTSEGRRLVEQGGVSVDGERVTDLDLSLAAGRTFVIQVGKRRFARVTVER